MNQNWAGSWQVKHLRRQAALVWLISHHLIIESIAEWLDNIDNWVRKIYLKISGGK